MRELWEFCRKLGNPERLGLLEKIYRLKGDGMTVNELSEGTALGQSATSQYLKQLLDLGLVKRERNERYVYYSADSSMAAYPIQEAAISLYKRFAEKPGDRTFVSKFAALGNAFRARAVHYIAGKAFCSFGELASKYGKDVGIIARDLCPAVEIGLLQESDKDGESGLSFVLRQIRLSQESSTSSRSLNENKFTCYNK